jgi:hypothetical protein
MREQQGKKETLFLSPSLFVIASMKSMLSRYPLALKELCDGWEKSSELGSILCRKAIEH